MKVSVVTPSFNQVPFIERTLLSVLSQDWPAIEHVVFDGGSSDGTTDILRKFGDKICWVSEKDDGQADAVNRGILATSGEIIGWLNSDDVYYSGTIRAVAEYFAAHPDVDVVYGMADHIDLDDHPFESYPTEPWDFARLQWHCFICQPAAFFRRSVIERYGLLDTKLHYCMDYEFWLRLALGGARFGYLDRKLAGSRMYAENKTQADRVKVHKEINDMFRERLGRVPARWVSNYAYILVASQRGNANNSIGYSLRGMLQTLLSDLRWNRRLSGDTLSMYVSHICRRVGRLLPKTGPEPGLLRSALVHILPFAATPASLDVSAEPSRERENIRLVGLYEDGWVRPTLSINYPAGHASRSLNMIFCGPAQSPAHRFNLAAFDGAGRMLSEHQFRRDETELVHIPLPETAGTVRIHSVPPFWLSNGSARQERRNVSVVVKRIEIKEPRSSAVVFDSPATGDVPQAKSDASAHLNIAFDISQTGANKAGCGYFADAMIAGMLRLAPQHSYLLLRSFGDFFFDQDIQHVKHYSGRNVSYAPGIDDRSQDINLWRSPDLGAKFSGVDILHANNFWCPRQPLSARLVYTLYDIGFIEEPSWTTEVNRVGCFAGVFNAAVAADFVVAISKFSRRHFLNVFPHFPPDRIEVVYPCSKFIDLDSRGTPPASCAGIEPQKFWLNVGTVEPRKNQQRLLRAYSRYLAAGGPPYPLVLAGGTGWLMEDFKAKIAELGLADRVILTGYVSDAELIWLYRNCYANVYVSLFEGFGLPVLEGMQFGAATITSNVTSIPEITADAAAVVDPLNEASIADAMLDLGRKTQLRLLLSDLGRQRAAQFKWPDSVRQTLDIYKRVLDMPKRVRAHG
jgi:glycosyltransferase involved in cell wall biosynthesis